MTPDFPPASINKVLIDGAHRDDPPKSPWTPASTLVCRRTAQVSCGRERLCRGSVKIGEPLAQDVLLHLAHGVARQLLDEDETLRQLELRQASVERGQDRLLVHSRVLGAD